MVRTFGCGFQHPLSTHASRIFFALFLVFLLPQGGLLKDHYEGRKVPGVQDFLASKVAGKYLSRSVHVPSVQILDHPGGEDAPTATSMTEAYVPHLQLHSWGA